LPSGPDAGSRRKAPELDTFEETIAAAPSDVWGFIVDPAALSAWFGADAWMDPLEGGAVRFRFGDGSVRRGTVELVDRFRLIRWRWREHRGAGFGLELGASSTVTIELSAVDGGTLVRITEEPASPVDASRPRGSRAS
jgi:uncharacterized protein YndB with AHSA1/START domain